MVDSGLEASALEKAGFDKLKKESNDVTCLVVACIDANFQNCFENSGAYESKTQRSRNSFKSKSVLNGSIRLKELVNFETPYGSLINTHVLMVRDLIFVTEYHMHSIDKSIPKLHEMQYKIE